MTLLKRLIDRVAVPEDPNKCWIWRLQKNAHGYGVMWHRNKRNYAHRISYTVFHGLIPEGMKICHSCDNPQCVNPAHLFIGSQADNMHDCYTKGRMKHGQADINREKTHCPSGHPYSGDNLMISSGRRRCKTCARVRTREVRRRGAL